MMTATEDAFGQNDAGVDDALTSERTDLIARIDDVLPQTQCQQCGYAGCKPYAAAIAQGSANINQCPPGGEAGIQALAALLSVPYLPLNTAHGMTKPKAIAVIDEQRCIGCTLCIKACPVDAILGASKQMHTVISQECTGCELCLAPCPVDCITLQPVLIPNEPSVQHEEKTKSAAALARKRHENRRLRLAREIQMRTKTATQGVDLGNETLACQSATPLPDAEAIKKSAMAAAMARVKALKSDLPASPNPGCVSKTR